MCRHRKWKLTRGEESDTDSGGESGGEVSAQSFYHLVANSSVFYIRL